MYVRLATLAALLVGCAPSVQSSTATTHVASSLLVTNVQRCPAGHDCDILEIIDIHTAATSEDKGFDQLRALAIEHHADAVIGAEFEHGDGDEPSHLSGMLVRYGKPVPPHTVIGEVEVESEGTDQDKGLAALEAKATALGADQVIDVVFDHGDNGAKGSLKGHAIRFDR